MTRRTLYPATKAQRDRHRIEKEVKHLREQLCECYHLIGCAIEALEIFPVNDGHAELIRAGLTAEYRRIREDEQ